ncbi:MAG: HD domain-containing protein [Bacteroidales bacterium]|nr:HD domain-containing protein [Candidatus Sodaliphilus fimicaballi]
MINEEIRQFLEQEIIPLYDHHDAGHQRDHAHYVMETSLQLAEHYPQVDCNMLLVAAAYHDVGLCEGRKLHHVVSARMMREDKRLLQWFTPEQIDIMADAAEDHRASSDHEPRTIYGRIIAESDRQIDGDTIIRRTIQYTQAHYPTMNEQEQYQRFIEHMAEKYAEGGYLKLWIPESANATRLAEYRELLKQPEALKVKYQQIYSQLEQNA